MTETEEEKHKRWKQREEARLVAKVCNEYVPSGKEDRYGCESEGEAYFFGHVDSDGCSDFSDAEGFFDGRVGSFYIMNENTGSNPYYC